MVDILNEVAVQEPKRTREIPTSVFIVLPILVVFIAAIMMVPLFRSGPPIGRELSSVSGVGIVRRGVNQRQKIVRNQINSSGSSKIYRQGYGLLDALCDATDAKLPVIIKVDLPAGKYRVSATTKEGGHKQLLEKLCVAYSRAFDVKVSQKEVEMDVYVMTCTDPLKLGLRKTRDKLVSFDGDFRGSNEQTQFDAEVSTGMGALADWMGYMIRKSWTGHDGEIRNRVLAAVVVDETGLVENYQGNLSWRFYVDGALIKELSRKGLKFTRAKRKIKAVVIE